MEYIVRHIRNDEIPLLKDFLYEAVFVPEGTDKPPRDIVERKELRVYTDDFGREGDIALVAETDGKVVGAAWTRIMYDYGHVGDGIPSWAIAVYEAYRGYGIGSALMENMLMGLREKGYRQTSLSVQKENPAWHLYRRMGFSVIDETEQEYIMLKDL